MIPRALGWWLLLPALDACGTTTHLVGEPTDGEGASDAGDGSTDSTDGEIEPDGTDAAGPDESGDGTGDDDGFTDETDGDGPEDGTTDEGGTSCPVFAVPSSDDPRADGTAEHPYGGLRRAVDDRGACGTIRLLAGPSAFAARVDIVLAAGETLTIEGDPGGPPAELDAAGSRGLAATGIGTLVLRHLAVRNGSAKNGGCLDADVGALTVEDTAWSGCEAVWDPGPGDGGWGAAIRVVADATTVRRSVFSDNTATNGAGIWLNGPRDTAVVTIEDCTFESNDAAWGAGIYTQLASLHSTVVRCRFVDNGSEQPGAALAWWGGVIGRFEGNRIAGNHGGEGPAVFLGGAPETSIRHNLFIGNRSDRCHPALTVAPAYGVVRNNLFVDNASEMGGPTCGGAVLLAGGRPDFRNNTLVDNSADGGPTDLALAATFGRVRNNLFLGGTGGSAVALDRDDEGTLIAPSYNDAWNASPPAFDPRLTLGDGNLFLDPLVVVGDRYRPGAGSPCIDAGDPDPALNDDDGSRNDIGALGGPDGEWTPLGP